MFDGLETDRIMLSRNSRSAKKFRLLYDRENEHYNVINNLKDAMAKQYIRNGCDTLYDFNTLTSAHAEMRDCSPMRC